MKEKSRSPVLKHRAMASCFRLFWKGWEQKPDDQTAAAFGN